MTSGSSRSNRQSLPVIRLAPVRGAARPDPAWPTANIQIKIGGRLLHLEISVPPGPTRVRELLPVFEGLTNAVVDCAVQDVEQQGLTISCEKGCGACCRQLVPISGAEAHHLALLVAAMPEPRRTQIRERFAEAIARVDAAGLFEPLRRPDGASGRELRPLGLTYFTLGIPCPFLEEESCSIHPDRPLACREYLVTSPAENCARPTPEGVQCVPMPAKISSAVRHLDKPSEPPWIPLTLALEWSAANAESPPARTGPNLLQELFAALT
jgi:Fe-S-cluster containining protein